MNITNVTTMGPELTTISSGENVTENILSSSGPSQAQTNGFWISFGGVFSPGIIAHIVALCCLLIDVRHKMTVIQQLLMALCLVDLVGVIIVLIHHGMQAFLTIVPSRLVCCFISFLMGFLPLMSGSITTMMAIDRCLKFKAPFWYNANIKSKKIKIPVIVWTLVLMTISLFPSFGLGYVTSSSGKKCSSHPTKIPDIYNSPEGIFIITYSVVGLTTVLVDISCNIAVIFTMDTMATNTARTNDNGRQNIEMAMVKMLLGLSVVFLITLTPLYVSLVILYAGTPLSSTVKIITHLLFGLSFSLDPFVYILAIKTYRQRLVRWVCGRGSSKQDKTTSDQQS